MAVALDEAHRTKAIVEEAVRDALGRQGLTIREVPVTIDWDMAGVILRRRHVGHEWIGNKGLGSGHPVIRKVAATATPARARATAERFIDVMLALQQRDRTIAANHDDSGHQPAWSVLVEPCALHLLRHANWHDRDILAFHRPQYDRYTAGDHGYTVGQDLPAGRVGEYRIGKPKLAISGGVLSLTELDISAPGMRLSYRGGPAPTLGIGEMDLPDTLMGAMRNRRVGEVVGHPALEGCMARITSARRKRVADVVPDLDINLARDLVPMAEAPEGVDVPWLETIARG